LSGAHWQETKMSLLRFKKVAITSLHRLDRQNYTGTLCCVVSRKEPYIERRLCLAAEDAKVSVSVS